jgi:hypothetical protein
MSSSDDAILSLCGLSCKAIASLSLAAICIVMWPKPGPTKKTCEVEFT